MGILKKFISKFKKEDRNSPLGLFNAEFFQEGMSTHEKLLKTAQLKKKQKPKSELLEDILDPKKIESGQTLWGDSFVVLSGGREIRVGYAGERFPQKFYDRVKSGKLKVKQIPPHWKEEIDSFISVFKNGFEKEEKQFGIYPGQLLKPLLTEFLHQDVVGVYRDQEHLDYVCFMEGVFSPPPLKFVEDYDQNDSKLFKRSAKVASLGTIMGILMGFYEYENLKAIWLALHTLDFPIASMKKREELRKASLGWSKTGILISKKLNQQEVSYLVSHPDTAERVIPKYFGSSINWDPALKSLPKFHHENFNANGPHEVSLSCLSDFHKISVFADRLADSPGGDWINQLFFIKEMGWKDLCPYFGETLIERILEIRGHHSKLEELEQVA